jgi:hypothetical protein
MSGNQQRPSMHVGEGSFCIPSESQLLHGYSLCSSEVFWCHYMVSDKLVYLLKQGLYTRERNVFKEFAGVKNTTSQ